MKKAGLVVVMLAVLGMVVAPISVAGCGIDHSNMDASTLMEAAAALKATNPALAAKVEAVALKSFPEKKAAAANEHGGKEHGGM